MACSMDLKRTSGGEQSYAPVTFRDFKQCLTAAFLSSFFYIPVVSGNRFPTDSKILPVLKPPVWSVDKKLI